VPQPHFLPKAFAGLFQQSRANRLGIARVQIADQLPAHELFRLVAEQAPHAVADKDQATQPEATRVQKAPARSLISAQLIKGSAISANTL
jgi:hypothetical protein